MQNGIGRMGWLVLLVASAWVSQGARTDKPEAQSPPQLDRFEASMLDKSISPCVDFYAYSCSKWQAAHPIPSDMSSVGTWTPLYLWNQTILREAMEKAAETPGAKGTEQQVGDYWKSCMNLDERAAKGMQWLAEALKARRGLYAGASHRPRETGRRRLRLTRHRCRLMWPLTTA